MGQVYAKVEDKADELGFRRGYRLGWLAAAKVAERLVYGRRITPKTACGLLQAHAAGPLTEWEQGSLGFQLYPPKMPSGQSDGK